MEESISSLSLALLHLPLSLVRNFSLSLCISLFLSSISRVLFLLLSRVVLIPLPRTIFLSREHENFSHRFLLSLSFSRFISSLTNSLSLPLVISLGTFPQWGPQPEGVKPLPPPRSSSPWRRAPSPDRSAATLFISMTASFSPFSHYPILLSLVFSLDLCSLSTLFHSSLALSTIFFSCLFSLPSWLLSFLLSL